MNGSVNATTPTKGWIGGIDDGVNVEGGDVGQDLTYLNGHG